MNKKTGYIALIAIAFVAGMFAKSYLISGSTMSSPVGTKTKQKILYWVAPMNPSYQRDKPGKSPMGMDLVPVYADSDSDEGDNIIKISSAVVSNLGVKVEPVIRRNLSRIIYTVGYATVDENKIEHIHAYTDGWVKKLYVKTTGEPVKKGQLLLELYSPTLNNAQEELLIALNSKNASLIRAGEKKLITLGMSKSQIKGLRKTHTVMDRVKIYSSQSGIVSRLNIREGKYIKPDTNLMTIEDLASIWIIAEVFERQADWVKSGQVAIATLPYIPGKKWQGRVDYVYPELDAKTHALRVRLMFPNLDLTIKPRMYADVNILSKTIKDALSIPREALIRTGEGDRVIIALGGGRFKPQAVKVGIESDKYFQVLAGLTKDDLVVTSAQFLIDSESSLKAGMARMESHEYSNGASNTPEKLIKETIGMGVVTEINVKKRVVVIQHEPIAELEMPSMTMALNVAGDINLNTIKPGDAIHFVLIKTPDNEYTVTKIHVVDNQE